MAGTAGDTADDGDLVRAVVAGDGAAVLALYRRYLPAVRAVVAAKVRGEDVIDDLTQETFTRALEHLPTLRRPERFRAWLLGIARNSATDRCRLELRQRDVDPVELHAVEAVTPAPESEVVHRLVASTVDRSIRRLSERDARALRLSTHHDLAPAEVGAALGLSPGAAKVAVHRARRRLRTLLAVDLLAGAEGMACPDHPGPDAAAGAADRHVATCDECLAATRATLADLVAA
jgi:RNA polymerase sigma factor (sigma-70 family)